MSAIPLARFLVEFGSESDIGQATGTGSGPRTGQGSARVAEDVAARIADALVRGQNEGRAGAEAQSQAKLETQREEFEQHLASQRLAWAEQEGSVLAERMLAAIRDMETRIGECTARILQPFLKEQVRRQAVTELVALVETMLSKDRNATLAVCGPDDLVAVLRERLQGVTANVTFASGDAPDVQISLDQTILQTNLGAWIARIEEAVA